MCTYANEHTLTCTYFECPAQLCRRHFLHGIYIISSKDGRHKLLIVTSILFHSLEGIIKTDFLSTNAFFLIGISLHFTN